MGAYFERLVGINRMSYGIPYRVEDGQEPRLVGVAEHGDLAM
jgi:hypothetical protein